MASVRSIVPGGLSAPIGYRPKREITNAPAAMATSVTTMPARKPFMVTQTPGREIVRHRFSGAVEGNCSRRLLIEADHVSSRVAEPRGDLGGVRADRLHDLAAVGDDVL